MSDRKLHVGALLMGLAALLAGSAALCQTNATAAAAAAPAGDVVRAELPNGLRVIIVRNTLAPVVSTSVNYLVGADETPPGFPGMAHAQEHMMFRGAPGLSADQLANIGSIMGGDFNADTRQTVTQYLYTVPAEDLDVALHIEALRMRDVDDGAKDWEKERGAIEQEVAQDLSSPTYVLFTELRAALFEGTRYAHDALGTRPSFDRTTAAMLKEFYNRWYAPNNAILVIVGDIDPAAALGKVTRLFGSIPRKTLPARPGIELHPVRAKSLQLESDLPYGMQVTAVRMPGLDSPDYPACEVLADVLSSQRGALYELVPQGKALFAGFDFEPLAKAGMGYATAAFPTGGDAGKLAQEVRAILARIARDGVPPDLVAAAKLQERRAAESEKNSIGGLASAWSEAVAVNGLDSPDEDLARIEQVTVEDVNRVARKYLDLDHAVLATLTPQGAGKPVAGRGFGGQESIALGEATPTPLPDWAQQALGRLTVPDSTVHPVVSQLSNGMTLIVQPEDVNNSVSVSGHIRNRPELEVPKGQEGLSMVLDGLFSYGSEHLDRIAFQSALDAIGAEEQAGTDFGVSVLKENFDRAVELLADNELHPALPEAAFRMVRKQVAQSVAGRAEQPRLPLRPRSGLGAFPEEGSDLAPGAAADGCGAVAGRGAALLPRRVPSRSDRHRGDRQYHAGAGPRRRREVLRRLEGRRCQAADHPAARATQRADAGPRFPTRAGSRTVSCWPKPRHHPVESRLLRPQTRQRGTRRRVLLRALEPRSEKECRPRVFDQLLRRCGQEPQPLFRAVRLRSARTWPRSTRASVGKSSKCARCPVTAEELQRAKAHVAAPDPVGRGEHGCNRARA